MTCSPRSSTGCRRPRPCPAGSAGRWPRCAARGPATSRATWTSPTAWTGGTWTPGPVPTRTGPTQTGPTQTWPGPADGERDYAAAADGPSAVLSSAVPRPAGSAALVQAIYADDYRGTIVTFSGEIRVDALTGQAGLRLEILRLWWERVGTREDHGLTIASRHRDWTRCEITVQIPADADLIRFGTALTGPGRIALRNPDLRRAEPGAEPGAERAEQPEPDAGTP